MARGKAVDRTIPMGSIENAVLNGDWMQARLNMAARLARMMDNTDCARDVKSICLSLMPLIDKCEETERQTQSASNTPLESILAEAEAALANA